MKVTELAMRKVGNMGLCYESQINYRKATLYLENPDFNYIIRSEKPEDGVSKFMHWYISISIVPRIASASGFELGSGMYINPLAPERSAEFLRNVKLPENTQGG
jgi:UDPglucose--hexose-1-phosphate uridylyltransferase